MLNPQAYLQKGWLAGKISKRATRAGFEEGLMEIGAEDDRVMVVSADLAESTRVRAFGNEYGERLVEVGVAEQNMMSVGAGLAMAGMVPFVASYATFSPARNWEQARSLVANSRANVKIVGHHAGLLTGPDGATHQGLEDVALMRVLPNMTVIVPADAEEGRKATIAAGKHEGPVYLRFFREETVEVTTKKTPFEIGKATVWRTGRRITIVTSGYLGYDGLRAGEELDGEVINMSTIKPLDVKTLVSSVSKTGRVVTVEDHQIAGGLGGAVAEALAENYPVPMRRIGVRDRCGQSGDADDLLKDYQMTWEEIVKAGEELLE